MFKINFSTDLFIKLLKPRPCKNINLIHVCQLTTTKVQLKSREATILNKLIGKSNKKRRLWQPEIVSKPGIMFDLLKPSGGKQHLRRIKVLNTVFMEHITDLMTGGEISRKIAGFCIEITEVKISQDFTFLSVYWTSSSSKSDLILENVLQEISFPLRHELTKLNVIGSIPRILFVKDTRCDQMNEIDKLLREADYGEDFLPTNPSLFPNKEFPINVQLDVSETTGECTSEEAEQKASLIKAAQQKEVDELMSLMKYDIFGLDQRAIMNRIKASVVKSKALHRKNMNVVEKEIDSHTEKENLAAINNRIESMKSKGFSEFLVKRKKAIEKEKKIQERALRQPPEHQMKEEEVNRRIQQEFEEDRNNFEYYHSKS